jgi:signal-transduction protein with cAMP-binding, CBS, and nucleotidyltransferase domain
MDTTLDFLDNIKPLPKGLKKLLNEKLVRETFFKKELLIREGFVSGKMWFVHKGLIGRQFETNEVTGYIGFTRENELLITPEFIDQLAQKETLVAIEESLCYSLTYNSFQYVLQCYPEFNHYLRIHAEAEYKKINAIIRACYRQSPSAKYQYILTHEPWMLQRLTLKEIAMYIGVNNAVLSRVRANINK